MGLTCPAPTDTHLQLLCDSNNSGNKTTRITLEINITLDCASPVKKEAGMCICHGVALNALSSDLLVVDTFYLNL